MKRLLVAIFLCVTGEAKAEWNGRELMSLCQHFESVERSASTNDGFCLGFINGVAEAWKETQLMDIKTNDSKMVPPNLKFCLLKPYFPHELIYVVKKYLQDHPAELHLDATSLVISALHDTFPCSAR
jgi:Ssp1 endopeptidase immunity protein Rap1a